MKILLIEDNPEIREFLKPALEAEAFSVDIAENGNIGAKMSWDHTYDLIILDYMLPDKNGWEVCQEIRNRGNKVPILALSVVNDTEKKVEFLNSGADDYLTKPFSFNELLARIRALLRRPDTFVHNTLAVGDLEMDLIQQTVRCGGQEVYLTRKEFELLEYLMRNPDRPLSRGMIIEHVWDMAINTFSNTIETHIFNLRRKLNEKASRQIIETLPGRGYKISSVSKITS
ncbi:MAG: response regulator transcription factor [Candidatus Nomurabacteria bacterium]|nr:MAG: response regulator transcription factor [Candidatus Nomurabacteria bacterium]